MKLAGIFSVALVFCFCTANLYADIYSWTDENGVKHYGNVTPPQRAEQIKEIQGNKSAATPITKQSSGIKKQPQEAEQIGEIQGNISVTTTTKRNGEIIKQQRTWIKDSEEWVLNDEDKSFFLSAAVNSGHLESVEQLLSEGADVNKSVDSDFTLLHLATWRGHTKIVELLLRKGADINAKKKDTGQTALDLAKEGGHKEIIALLRKYGASD